MKPSAWPTLEVLPFDYATYARDITSYLDVAQRKASDAKLSLDFAPAFAAADRFAQAAARIRNLQDHASGDVARLNDALRQVETDFTSSAGLPNRPWYKHLIYAPGEYTGYAAVVIPGVNEAIEAQDDDRAAQQLTLLTTALTQATETLNSVE